MSAPALEANLCGGTTALPVAVVTPSGGTWTRWDDCPGCVGCDHDTVAARSAQMTVEQAFALLPTIDERPF